MNFNQLKNFIFIIIFRKLNSISAKLHGMESNNILCNRIEPSTHQHKISHYINKSKGRQTGMCCVAKNTKTTNPWDMRNFCKTKSLPSPPQSAAHEARQCKKAGERSWTKKDRARQRYVGRSFDRITILHP